MADQDINFADMVKNISAGWKYWLSGAVVGLSLALLFILISIPRFEARLLIGPADNFSNLNIESQTQTGTTAYRYNPQNPSPQSGQIISPFTQFDAKSTGVAVASLLLRDDKIRQGIASDHRFIFTKTENPDDLTATKIAAYIAKNVKFDPYGETALRDITYDHPDAHFAQYLISQIHRTTDQLIRSDLRSRVNERILYLERAIARTLNPEQRRVMTNLLMNEERTRMLVSMDAPVAAQIYDPVMVSDKQYWPNTPLILALFTALGSMIGYIIFAIKMDLTADKHRANKPVEGDLRYQLKNPSGSKRPLKYGSWFKPSADNTNTRNNHNEDDAQNPNKSAKQ